VGDVGNNRYFFVNQSYGGCPADTGWLVAAAGSGCTWESTRGAPGAILYANSTTVQNWNNTNGTVALADALAVFVQ
jgi:hypothetical protein